MLNLYQVFELPGSEPQRGFQRPKVEVHCCSSSDKETTKVGGLGTGSNSLVEHYRATEQIRVHMGVWVLPTSVKGEYNESAGSIVPQ
jgi:hypothetical protein